MTSENGTPPSPGFEEEVVLRGSSAELRLPGSAPRVIPLAVLMETLRKHAVAGLDDEPFPDGLRFRVTAGSLSVLVLELKPAVRLISWISPRSQAPFGPQATYEPFRLATPFVIVKAPFADGRLLPACEVFYSNQPLRSLDSPLYYPNLLNVSVASYGCTAWLCTQYLGKELLDRRRGGGSLGITDQLDALVTHLWDGPFNRSSEVHEGLSTFQMAVDEALDPRVTDVGRWQEESARNPEFILQIPWKPTGLTVRELVVRQIEAAGARRELAQTAEIVSLLLGAGRGRRRGRR